jgi:SAM-dependent methyltransferase
VADYHSYIYDTAGRRIVGDFEGAYRDCEDVWPTQHDVHTLKYRTVIHIMKSLGPGARLADIGAGYGDFVDVLLREGLDATGYEIAATAVARGRDRFGLGERLQVGDLKAGIPAPDAGFDVITLFGVFWFLLDRLDEAMAEVKRLMKPGGTFVVSMGMVPNPIGGEIVNSYDDFIGHLRHHFDVREAMLAYLHAELAGGKPLPECTTDMVVYCRAK